LKTQEYFMIKIYRLLCEETGKSYIGQTKYDISARFKEHVNGSQFGKNKLANAIRKYGADKFQQILLDEVEDDIANARERYYVKFYDSFHNGYNSTRAGEWVPKPPVTDKTREKMGRNNRWKDKPRYGAENPNYGKKWSAEMKAAMSEKKKGIATRTGAVLSEDTKKKIGDANRGNAYRTGQINSDEHRRKISEANKGKKRPIAEKEYDITFPDGHVERIKGLVQFCNTYDLHKGNIFSKSGSKKYKARKIQQE
jgi:group I intron endonuclease